MTEPAKPKPIRPKTMGIHITFLEELLGTACSNPEFHNEFIASKSADKEKMKEELASLTADELMEKSVTIFHRDDDGHPFLYDYQIKGFIKEALGVTVEFTSMSLQKKPSVTLSKYTYKRIVDSFIFVSPRTIPLRLPEGGDITLCSRPLRADTMKGERIAISTSEAVPAGTTIDCTILWLNSKLEEYVRTALDYGLLKGIGQWRNSGKGRFIWEEIPVINMKKSSAKVK